MLRLNKLQDNVPGKIGVKNKMDHHTRQGKYPCKVTRIAMFCATVTTCTFAANHTDFNIKIMEVKSFANKMALFPGETILYPITKKKFSSVFTYIS
jgi:hypothetical protein